MTPALRVVSLSGGYTKAPVLRDVNLQVAAREIVAVFGANGAGKTTLLRGLCGALPICDGEIHLEGRRIDNRPIWARAQLGLAHVPEGRQVFASMTVHENLEAGGLARRASTAIEEVFELFPRLADRRHQRAATLSGGEQQMLAIGRALMSSPAVLLIDEMSAGLAPLVVERLAETLVRIRDRGAAVMLVEQAPQLVEDVIDRAYLVEQGRIVGHGSLQELGGANAIAKLYLGVVGGHKN
jgi:branched-chain amino acid transport system ATP-binding protein